METKIQKNYLALPNKIALYLSMLLPQKTFLRWGNLGHKSFERSYAFGYSWKHNPC